MNRIEMYCEHELEKIRQISKTKNEDEDDSKLRVRHNNGKYELYTYIIEEEGKNTKLSYGASWGTVEIATVVKKMLDLCGCPYELSNRATGASGKYYKKLLFHYFIDNRLI